jgi:lipid II:glycine glycyltransferase (peptidoglycan interpeptide bridge formation enzyme)
MKRDVADDSRFSDHLEKGKYFDIETPYGYGGPIAEGNVNDASIKRFWNGVFEFARNNRIVTQFICIHPLLRNEIKLDIACDRVIYLKDTIMIDTSSKNVILENMDSKTRNMVRKAQKLGVRITFDSSNVNLSDMYNIYRHTMDIHKADSFYYFSKDYFEYVCNHLSSNVLFAYAHYEGKIIGAAVFLFTDRFMHYHLSGTYTEYRDTAATSLLLFEGSVKAHELGINSLHLGGGIDAEDSLFFFKKRFNNNGRRPFYIARTIFDDNMYKKLINVRTLNDPSFDLGRNYLIKYRG